MGLRITWPLYPAALEHVAEQIGGDGRAHGGHESPNHDRAIVRCTLGSRAPDYRRLESGSDRAGNSSRAPDYRRLESGSDRAVNIGISGTRTPRAPDYRSWSLVRTERGSSFKWIS